MFEWKNEYSVGVDVIDQQHQKLFEIGRKIHKLLVTYSGQDSFNTISNLIGELSNYTAYHFQTEEELFNKYNYPDTESHIKEHQYFIDYLNSLNLGVIDDNQKDAIMDLLKFISKWIFRHINSTDFQYRDFFKEVLN
ncbi:hemerythrin family protein [Clostridium sp. 'deep sea']|uniref:bacteriohemerythrin n=1 Tax=Clostridium sp. 'deep sea' TaxID=2779445 RepID=UPI001896A460|nr:bacteriohemerythrin [Clostridium sp. 'deep sea']QOR35286.1 hemerythrin family protein [Clostridium sp. 'deep sea']